jgi:hypothetical protein
MGSPTVADPEKAAPDVFGGAIDDQVQATAHELAKAGDNSFPEQDSNINGDDAGVGLPNLPPPLEMAMLQEAMMEHHMEDAFDSHSKKVGGERNMTFTSPQVGESENVATENAPGSTRTANTGAILLKKARVDQATRWNNMFEALVEYKKEHGTCLVPLQNGPLGKW